QFHRFATGIGTNGSGAVHGAQQHFLAATASGKEADPDLDQSHVELGVRLASGGVQRDFATAAERESEGRAHHRLRRKFYGLRHALKLTDGEVHVVPLFLLDRHEQQHHVGADGKIRRVVGDDESVEAIARSARLQRLENQRDNVGAEGVHFGVELDAAHAFAQVNQRGTGIFLYHVVGLLRRGNRPHSRRRFDRLETPVVQVEVGSARWRLWIVLVPGLCVGGEQFFYVG